MSLHYDESRPSPLQRHCAQARRTLRAKCDALAVPDEGINLRRKPDRAVAKLENTIAELRGELAQARDEIAKLKIRRTRTYQHPVHRIIDLVCLQEGIDKQELISDRRHAQTCEARQIGYYLSAAFSGCSLPQIGLRFKRDHSSLVHGRNKIKQRRARDLQLDARLKWYEAQIQAWETRQEN